MSQDEEPKKTRRRGKPPTGEGNGTSLLAKKRRQHAYSLMERVRERIDPDVLIDFHLAILQGQNPMLIPDGDTWKVIPDPNAISITPTLEQKTNSAKWLTDRGHGLPVQSTQVDIDIRARIDQMGSGVHTNVLANHVSPRALKLLQEALRAPSNEDVIDVEFSETVNDEKPLPSEDSKGELDKNNPLPVADSGDSDNQ